MDLARNLDPCHLPCYPKTDDLSKQKSIFLLASVSLTFVVVWYLVLPGEMYFTATWWSYDVTSVVHWAGSEKPMRDPAPRPRASAPFLPLSWYSFFLSDLESFFFSRDAIANNGVLQYDRLCALCCRKLILNVTPPQKDSSLATDKQRIAGVVLGVKTKTNLATETREEGKTLFKMGPNIKLQSLATKSTSASLFGRFLTKSGLKTG